MIRIVSRPTAACQDSGCLFRSAGGWHTTATTVRNDAQRHVRATGHTVLVTITDATEYGPEAGSGEAQERSARVIASWADGSKNSGAGL